MKTLLRYHRLLNAAESRIARRLAKSAPHKTFREIFSHQQRVTLRKEARELNIAYGFLRGRKLLEIERPYRPKNEGHISSKGQTKTHPNWENIEALVKLHGQTYFDSEQSMLQRFAEFRSAADAPDACAV